MAMPLPLLSGLPNFDTQRAKRESARRRRCRRRRRHARTKEQSGGGAGRSARKLYREQSERPFAANTRRPSSCDGRRKSATRDTTREAHGQVMGLTTRVCGSYLNTREPKIADLQVAVRVEEHCGRAEAPRARERDRSNTIRAEMRRDAGRRASENHQRTVVFRSLDSSPRAFVLVVRRSSRPRAAASGVELDERRCGGPRVRETLDARGARRGRECPCPRRARCFCGCRVCLRVEVACRGERRPH